MTKFVVSPHFRLQEWVAEQKGYFTAEGLDYEFREALDSRSGHGHQLGDKVGAYQTLEAGRTCNVSAACHWTMNVAASNLATRSSSFLPMHPARSTCTTRITWSRVVW